MTPPKIIVLGSVQADILVVGKKEMDSVCMNPIGWNFFLPENESRYPDSLAVHAYLSTGTDSYDFYNLPTRESTVEVGWIPFGLRALRETGVIHLGRYVKEIKTLEYVHRRQGGEETYNKASVSSVKSLEFGRLTDRNSEFYSVEMRDIHKLIQEGERIYSDEGDWSPPGEEGWVSQGAISERKHNKQADPEEIHTHAISLLNRLWCLNGVFAATLDYDFPKTNVEFEELCLHVEAELYSRNMRGTALKRKVEWLKARVRSDVKKASRYVSDETKAIVMARDGGVCQECGSAENLHFDHDYPYSLGGSNDVENIRILCSVCNQKRGNLIRK